MKLNINAKLFAAIAKFRAKNDIRYYLEGVYVEPLPTGGAVIVATNGFTMGVWRDPYAIVERPAILRVSKPLIEACSNSDLCDPRLELLDGCLTVTTAKVWVYAQPDNGDGAVNSGWEIESARYPDWRPVFDEPCETGTTDHINPKYFGTINKALKAGTGRYFGGITMRQSESLKSIAIFCPEVPDFAAIIMPMRAVNQTDAYPQWFKDAKATCATVSQEPPSADKDAAQEVGA